ncbi:MAG: extracellular solute-binding protein, partial [Treponema sp.]|nr:extracellular solute-binding protein [Treponema sp.]
MKKTKLMIAAVMVMIVTGRLFAGAQGDKASQGQANISFMGWGSPQEVAVFKAMIAQFEAKYPGTKVDYVSVPSSDFNTKLQTMIGARQIPDVFYLQPENVMPWANNGILYDMTNFVASN